MESSFRRAAQLGLNCRDGHRVDNVGNRASSTEVVDWLVQPLQHWTNRDRTGGALHRLVGVIAGVQIGENEHGCSTGHFAARLYL